MNGRVALFVVVSLLGSAACGGGASKADAAAGGSAAAGTSGAAGTGGGNAAGTGGGNAAGTGGTGGGNVDGGATLSSCPTEEPTTQPACTGTLYCSYNTGCSCVGCCAAVYNCTDGRLTSSGINYNDSCIVGIGCGGRTICTVAEPRSCNDDPDAGSINGTCSGQGLCVCPPGRLNPDSGRCLPL